MLDLEVLLSLKEAAEKNQQASENCSAIFRNLPGGMLKLCSALLTDVLPSFTLPKIPKFPCSELDIAVLTKLISTPGLCTFSRFAHLDS